MVAGANTRSPVVRLFTKANLSQHLAILRAAGTVTARRNGRHLDCSLAIPEIKDACQLIHKVLRAQIKNGRRIAI